jgi:signal transduction histidine kinase
MIQEDHAIAQLDALSRIMNVGALVLGPAAGLEFASPIACELLGVPSLAELHRRWDGLKRSLLGDAAELSTGPVPSRRVADLRLGEGERSLRVEIYRLGEAATGYLVLVKDRRTVDMLETDLVLASQMRSLAHVYRVLAHDLRAPLNSMQLAVDLLDDASGDPDPARTSAASQERRRRHLAILREELARLDRIVRTMLEQKEPIGSASSAFDLREVIQEIGRLLLPQARRQHVEMKFDLPGRAVTVTGYRDRLKQALLNLAIRALEAMPDGGRLMMGAGVEGTAAVATVEDSGPGVPAALLDEIYQIHYTTRKSASGIGLYMARLVVESHGGEIVEEGRPGEGARFRLTLPLE